MAGKDVSIACQIRGNAFRQGHDRQGRRVAERVGEERGVGEVEVEPRAIIVERGRFALGQRLPDITDITIDNWTPAGDATVRAEAVEDPAGPNSTLGEATVINVLKMEVAAALARRGRPPLVRTTSARTEGVERLFRGPD
jgi:hypothetical protein